MEFLVANLINTSTLYSVNNGSITVENLMSSDVRRQFQSDGDDDDTTITSLTVTFSETTTVNRIALMGMNWKQFNIYYDGTTANTLAMTTTADTTVSQWTGNTDQFKYLTFSTISVASLTFEATKTLTANQEKAIGYIVASALDLDFTRIPSADGYKPVQDNNEKTHKLSDGGARSHFIRYRYGAKIKLKYVATAMRDSLRTIYEDDDSRVFVAFPTSTGWDRILFNAIWVGPFDFMQYSTDADSSGFTGTINLVEGDG